MFMSPLEKNKDVILIKGARVHNLKNLTVAIPKNKLVVICGVSGSGKSSLAFDTIFAEGQRRYVESLSSYARQFLGMMKKPELESIEGLSPAIAIEQKNISANPRSTVGTVTEIYDHLRLLFARIGRPHCARCSRPIRRQSVAQITSNILDLPKRVEIVILAPLIRGKKGEHREVLGLIESQGFLRIRINGEYRQIEDVLKEGLDRYRSHTVEVVVDRLILRQKIALEDKERIIDSIETALKIGSGVLSVHIPETDQALVYSEKFSCLQCGTGIAEIEPRTFSFNSPYGACSGCSGLGEVIDFAVDQIIPNPKLSIAEGAIKPWMTASHRVGRQGWYWMLLSELAQKEGFSLHSPFCELPDRIQRKIIFGDDAFEGVIVNLKRRYQQTESEGTRQEIEKYTIMQTCRDCQGTRLKKESRSITVLGRSITDLSSQSIKELHRLFNNSWTRLAGAKLTSSEQKIAQPIVREIGLRLRFLTKVGLEYLTLDRRAGTLAGGEAQRIKLATQIGSGLSGVIYILDEPSIGLHQRDQSRLIATLKSLRDLQNTVIVVEHDRQTIENADWVVEIGPGSGRSGGRVVFSGTHKDLLKKDTITGRYLAAGKNTLGKPSHQDDIKALRGRPVLEVIGAREHNLKNINARIPLGCFICVSGVSGSGKSTLVHDILARALNKHFYRSRQRPGKHKLLKGIEHLDRIIEVDQSPIGRTPRSNPATYTGLFAQVRELFSQTSRARARGFRPGRFSFNVKGGRCEECQGEGQKTIEMQFMAPVNIECEVCHGTRYRQDVLEITYRGNNIAQILEMSVEEALEFFTLIPPIKRRLQTLKEVGLEYIALGQSATTLSGGEAQRIKLARELAKTSTGRTLYILDEPTTGLHFAEVTKLTSILRRLVEKGNTVIVIEHNLDLIASCDWIIDLGPEGGDDGGRIVAEGPPAKVANHFASHTGHFLKQYFN